MKQRCTYLFYEKRIKHGSDEGAKLGMRGFHFSDAGVTLEHGFGRINIFFLITQKNCLL